jgi:hypothetical protein
MSAFARHSESPFVATDWQPDVTQLLDEHHIVAWCETARMRVHFGVSLGRFLQSQRDAEVCNFYGQYITDLETFCHQLERAMPGPRLDRRIDGVHGVAALLRSRETNAGRPACKFRYYIWHDADMLLRANRDLFARLVDAIGGVAAEAEYVSDDLLLLHRAVFVGGPALDHSAGDPRGQFQCWYPDEFEEPFWQVVTGIARPPFTRYRIDSLGAAEEGESPALRRR